MPSGPDDFHAFRALRHDPKELDLRPAGEDYLMPLRIREGRDGAR
jgi:hypothetical protein